MARQALDAVLQHIRKVAAGSQKGWQDDRELLERFIDRQDRAAFAALMQRHGPMVRGVCWRLLRHEADTDDAFQATFLVMLRKARSIRKRRSLGSWLYGVAFRTALRARAPSRRNEGDTSCGGRPRRLPSPGAMQPGGNSVRSSTKSCRDCRKSIGTRWCCATWKAGRATRPPTS
jgi:hypothetical protein